MNCNELQGKANALNLMFLGNCGEKCFFCFVLFFLAQRYSECSCEQSLSFSLGLIRILFIPFKKQNTKKSHKTCTSA